MSEPQELRKRSHPWTWVTVVVAMPVLYVLSIGPVWAWMTGTLPDPFVTKPTWYRTAYGPVEDLALKTGCSRCLWDYKFWCHRWMHKP